MLDHYYIYCDFNVIQQKCRKHFYSTWDEIHVYTSFINVCFQMNVCVLWKPIPSFPLQSCSKCWWIEQKFQSYLNKSRRKMYLKSVSRVVRWRTINCFLVLTYPLLESRIRTFKITNLSLKPNGPKHVIMSLGEMFAKVTVLTQNVQS